MKNTYIFGGGDSDGLLGIATILRHVDDAFFSFTSPRTLHTLVHDFVKGYTGQLYIVDLAIDDSSYKQLFNEIKRIPGFKTYYFDQHNLPNGVSLQDLPFTSVSINPKVSSCENAYDAIKCDLDPMIPAIASINDETPNTRWIKEAEGIYGNRLYKNAAILKFGLAFNIKDNKFKQGLVYAIKGGRFPESIPELVDRYEQGLKRWEEIVHMADRTVKTTNNLAYGYFPNLRGGWANMFSKHLAESNKKPVGVSILKTLAAERGMSRLQKIKVISNNPSLNIGVIVHEVAVKLGGFGGGSVSSAGATIDIGHTKDFLDRLDKMVQV